MFSNYLTERYIKRSWLTSSKTCSQQAGDTVELIVKVAVGPSPKAEGSWCLSSRTAESKFSLPQSPV